MKSTQRLLHQMAELAVLPSGEPSISLNNLSNGLIDLPAGRVVTLQLYSPSDTTRELLFRVVESPDAGATTPANMFGFLGHGGTDARRTPEGEPLFCAWSLRDRNGNAVSGAANDVICVTVEGD